MALINTDWTKELEQVNQSLSKLLNEEVQPMVDKALDRSVEEVEVALNRASFEVQEAIKQLAAEMDKQRALVIDSCKKLIFISFGGMAILVVLFFVVANLFSVNKL
jgi:F0F1-type ATP synthase membrane subunit b/b'